jgi:hypothetical protein
MTALARITSDPIGQMMPWTAGDERLLRNRLLRAQQYAATRALASTSPTARDLLWLINSTAAAQVTSRGSVEHLRDVADTLLRLTLVANGFERWENSRGR